VVANVGYLVDKDDNNIVDKDGNKILAMDYISPLYISLQPRDTRLRK
jgi:hypothetical protein